MFFININYTSCIELQLKTAWESVVCWKQVIFLESNSQFSLGCVWDERSKIYEFKNKNCLWFLLYVCWKMNFILSVKYD